MNGHSNIDTNEATEHLKNILNVGKADSSEGANIKSLSIIDMETSDVDAAFGNENTFQQIELTGNEESVSIYGTEVTIYSSPLLRGVNSSNIMIDNIVEYGWEPKYYLGCLVSIHLSKKYLAYALKAVPDQGFIRVIKRNTNNHLLLRGFKGGAKDLSFAHSMSRILLGCVDDVGELFVYEIFDKGSELTNRLCVHIVRPNNSLQSSYHRITWCPYVPEDGSGMENNDLGQDDVTMLMSSLLVVTHDEKAEIWNIDILMKEYGEGDIPLEKVKIGLQLISKHKEPITAAAFSPDAIALATASHDGEVKFFQVNMQENEGSPKCLHKWTPHYGKPLSSLFFLDNHKNYSSDVQFWKFAITGADNNQEIKVWSCKTWSCLQTIRILPCDADGVAPCLKAEIDLSASHLILSDINRKVLYIMKIRQEPSALICSLSEYVVKYPVLSFSIVDVVPYRGKPSLNCKNSADEEDDDDEDEKDDDYDDSDSIGRKQLSYMVKLFWIHAKSFQFCRIIYNPKTVSPLQSIASISSSQDSFIYKDGLSDICGDVPDQIDMNEHVDVIRPQKSDTVISPNKCNIPPNSVLASSSAPLPSTATASLASHLSPGYKECSEVLLTPRDFTSLHTTLPSVSIANSFKISGMDGGPDLNVNKELAEQDEIPTMDSDHDARPRRKSSQHSCTSSPSREVAEILSPNQILSHENESVSPQIKEDTEIPNRKADDLQATVLCQAPALVRRQQEYVPNDWPQAPDPNKEYKVVSRNDGEIHMQLPPIDQNSIRHNMPTLTDGEISPDDLLQNSIKATLQRLGNSIDALSLKVNSVAETVQRQNQAIQLVQNEIQGLQQHQKYIQSNLPSVDTLDTAIYSKIEHIISENAASEFARLENLFSKRDTTELQRYEEQATALSQNLVSGVSSRMDKVMKQEIKSTIMPHMSKYLDTLVQHLQGEFLQKLNSTDSALKECLGKHLRSKAFGDNLAASAVSLLQQSIQVACKEVFQNNVMPSLDKCCQLLFSQMNEVFTKGSIDYIEKLEKHLQMTSMNLDSTVKGFEEQINKLMGDAQNVLGQISARSAEALIHFSKEQENLIIKVRQAVQEEVHKAMREHETSSAAAMRSRQSTPAPQNDPQVSPQYILQLAKQGQINEAFQQALSAVDVKLVLFLCETVSVEQVFEPTPCPLAQHVLLSLIHQLSGDLHEKTEIKLRYIEDAIASLDNNNPLTKEHIGRVLGTLKQRVSLFMKMNPSHKLLRNCRRILLAVDFFLK